MKSSAENAGTKLIIKESGDKAINFQALRESVHEIVFSNSKENK